MTQYLFLKSYNGPKLIAEFLKPRATIHLYIIHDLFFYDISSREYIILPNALFLPLKMKIYSLFNTLKL